MSEYRKLISFGRSSHVVSLPKSWLDMNHLKKGAMILVTPVEHDLLLSPKKEEKEIEEKSIEIPIDGKEERTIWREIVAAYTNNYKTIILTGRSIRTKTEKIQRIIQNLMALEIMEISSSRIVARDFIDLSNISIKGMLKKMDMLIRNMFIDLQKDFGADTYHNLKARDKDVNRLLFLIQRTIRYALEHSLSFNEKISSMEMFNTWIIINNLETIGDECKRIAQYLNLINNKEIKKHASSFLQKSESIYLAVMKGVYKSDKQLIHNAMTDRHNVLNELDILYEKNFRVRYIAHLVNRAKVLLNSISEIGKVSL